MRLIPSLLLLCTTALPIAAQNPLLRQADAIEGRGTPSQPAIRYTLRVTPGDTTGFDVTLELERAATSFRLAMPRHPEYDEKYWRQVREMHGESKSGQVTIVREDSALWRVRSPGGAVRIQYRVEIAPIRPGERAAWRPLIRSDGAMIGGPYGLLYLVGAELAPAHMHLDIPAEWSVATGLVPTADAHTFFAPSTFVLMDSPVQLGRFHTWQFTAGGVPHRVTYWPGAHPVPFDTVRLVQSLQRLTTEAIHLFGRAPYREYSFLLQDDAYGALEHLNSLTLGAASSGLATDMPDALSEIAHEYFHAWNLMRIRPAEYPWLTWRTFPPSAGLWWSEGVTMLYADLLLRRAGVLLTDSSRTQHLEGLIDRYLTDAGNSHLSPERVSRAEYVGRPDALGDYQASPHLQGELLGVMIDLMVRHATQDRRTLDDVMREMHRQYGGTQGFTGASIERVVTHVCGCAARPFFDAYVRGATPFAFDRYLAMAGLQLEVTRTPGTNREGSPAADRRVYVWNREGESTARLLLTDPRSSWGRAGLHSGDLVLSVNDAPVPDWPAFRALLGGFRVGDSVRVVVSRPAGPLRTVVVIDQAESVRSRITRLPGATAAQQAIGAAWRAGRN